MTNCDVKVLVSYEKLQRLLKIEGQYTTLKRSLDYPNASQKSEDAILENNQDKLKELAENKNETKDESEQEPPLISETSPTFHVTDTPKKWYKLKKRKKM